MPEGVKQDILKGMYRLSAPAQPVEGRHVQLMRSFFKVDRHFIALAALKALADDGSIAREKVSEAITLYGIDPEKQNPAKV